VTEGDRSAPSIVVRPATDADLAWVTAFDDEAWGGPLAARLGELIDLRSLPALVATLHGERAGLARYAIRGDACEMERGSGVNDDEIARGICRFRLHAL